MKRTVLIPFEMRPCPEHEWSCGGESEPRHDLPVFTDPTQILEWMLKSENIAKQKRSDGSPVLLSWFETDEDEARKLGFNLPEEKLH